MCVRKEGRRDRCCHNELLPSSTLVKPNVLRGRSGCDDRGANKLLGGHFFVSFTLCSLVVPKHFDVGWALVLDKSSHDSLLLRDKDRTKLVTSQLIMIRMRLWWVRRVLRCPGTLGWPAPPPGWKRGGWVGVCVPGICRVSSPSAGHTPPVPPWGA